MNHELIYFLMPIAGLSRMIAGTWFKAFDRFIFPILITLSLYLFLGWSWWLIPTLIGFIVGKTRPITLFGDSIRRPWVNRVWCFVLGFIQSVSGVFVFLDVWGLYLILCIVPMVIYGATINLSNIDKTDRFFRWKFVEFVTGFASIYPICFLIGG